MKKTLVWIIILIILVAGLAFAVKDVARYREAQNSDSSLEENEENDTQQPIDQASVVGQIEVALNQKADFSNVKIMPTKVLEDSRCPIDVQCIQAGRVRVEAIVETPMETSTQVFVMNVPVTIGPAQITLLDVDPVKLSTATIDLTDYIFNFEIKEKKVSEASVLQ